MTSVNGIKLTELSPMDIGDNWPKDINGNINPFHQDFFLMGTPLGLHHYIMMENHTGQDCRYFIIVNTLTGQRTKVSLKQ